MVILAVILYRGRPAKRFGVRIRVQCRVEAWAITVRIHDRWPRMILGETGRNFAAGMSGGIAYDMM